MAANQVEALIVSNIVRRHRRENENTIRRLRHENEILAKTTAELLQQVHSLQAELIELRMRHERDREQARENIGTSH